MKVEKWNRSRLSRFLPILRQLQGEDFQSELTEISKNLSSAKVIEFLEEIIPKGFVEDISLKIYEGGSINITIQFVDINLEFVVQKNILSSDNVVVDTYFVKMGRNPGKIELDEFLGFFFLPVVTDWSPTETDKEGEFVRLLKKLHNIELREELGHLLITDCKSMMKKIRSKFNLNHYSNYKFKLESILLEENVVVKNSSVEDLFVKIHCYSKEDILLFTTPICFKRDTRVSMNFKFVEIQEMMNCKPTSKMNEENFVKSFLETALYWYRFS
jgi:hypothetical protein